MSYTAGQHSCEVVSYMVGQHSCEVVCIWDMGLGGGQQGGSGLGGILHTGVFFGYRLIQVMHIRAGEACLGASGLAVLLALLSVCFPGV